MWFHLELKGKGYEAARSVWQWVTLLQDLIALSVPVVSMPENFPLIWMNRHSNNGYAECFALCQMVDSAGVDLPLARDCILKRDFEGGQMAKRYDSVWDDDGKAYHIFASEENLTPHIAELSDDYLSHTGKYVRGACRTEWGRLLSLKRTVCTGW